MGVTPYVWVAVSGDFIWLIRKLLYANKAAALGWMACVERSQLNKHACCWSSHAATLLLRVATARIRACSPSTRYDVIKVCCLLPACRACPDHDSMSSEPAPVLRDCLGCRLRRVVFSGAWLAYLLVVGAEMPATRQQCSQQASSAV
jgi:hypothetical protein